MKRQFRTLAAILLLLWGAPSARAAENKPPSPARNSLSRARVDAGGRAALQQVISAVCLACATSAVGLWRGNRWCYRLAIGLIATNLVADVVNVVLGAALLVYLGSRRVRAFFRIPRADRLAF